MLDLIDFTMLEMPVCTYLPMISIKAMDSDLLYTRLFRNYREMQKISH